jgi:23S rRNA pseudouridine2605 synthase
MKRVGKSKVVTQRAESGKRKTVGRSASTGKFAGAGKGKSTGKFASADASKANEKFTPEEKAAHKAKYKAAAKEKPGEKGLSGSRGKTTDKFDSNKNGASEVKFKTGGKGRTGAKPGSFKKEYSDGGEKKFAAKRNFSEDEDKPKSRAPKISESMRLNRYLANAGICSRREADTYIEAGIVTINGKVVTELGTKVMFNDVVKFNDAPLAQEKKVYILLNKPKDYVTTLDDPHAKKTVIDLIKNGCKERVYPVGRLDKATTGLLLLTNDGDLADFLSHPRNNKKKIYQATLDKVATVADLQTLYDGVQLEDGIVKADEITFVNQEDKREVGIEIHSGKNRVVRRMFEHLGYEVKKLDRVYFAGLTKKNLPRGKWRFLVEKEIVMLKRGIFD